MPSVSDFFKAQGVDPVPRPGMTPRDETPEGVLIEGGVDIEEPVQPARQSVSDLMKSRGVKPVQIAPPQEPEPESPQADAKPVESVVQSLRKTRSALEAEGIDIRDNIPEGPGRTPLENDWMKRWSEQNALEREEELAQKITFNGKTDPAFRNSAQSVRRLESALHGITGTIQATTASIFGDQEKANRITQSLNDLDEYNALLDRNSIFGSTAGPMIGAIGESLAVSSATVAASGPIGVAGLFGLDAFNGGMEEAKDLTPQQQARHATVKAGVDFFTTLAGGALAQKAGVASGETVVPLMGKVSKELFSIAGLKQLAVDGSKAGFFEGAEEGVQQLLGGLEDVRSGVRENLDGLLDETLVAFSTGAVVGNVAQVSQSASGIDVKMEHVKRLVEGVTGRLKKGEPKANAKPNEVKITPEGETINSSDLDAQLDALEQLDTEITEQFESGGAQHLRQSIAEQKASVVEVDKEMKDLRIRRNKFTNQLGRTEDSASIKNIDNRMEILQNYKTEIQERTTTNEADLATWTKDFEQIHKDERAFLDGELNRLTKLRELPNATPQTLNKLEGPKKGGEDTGSTNKTEGQQKAGEAEAAGTEGKVEDLPGKAEGDSKGDDGSATQGQIPTKLDESAQRVRQQDQALVREVLELDKLPQQDVQSTEFALAEAGRQGLVEAAPKLAQEALSTGRILNSVEIAGLQLRYVSELNVLTEGAKNLRENADTLTPKAQEAQQLVMDDALDLVNQLTEAEIQSSSDAGRALQAQQRVFGVVYGDSHTVVQGRRKKGEDLTTEETEVLTDAAKGVRDAADTVSELEPGTDAFDRADFALSEAMMEHTAAVQNLEPSSLLAGAVESFNAVRMGLTLSGDLPPLGRQGFVGLLTSPVQTAKNIKSFYKPFLQKDIRDVKLAGFVAERSLREMKNFNVLTKEYGVPMISEHTKYSDAEASGVQRMRTAATFLPDVKRLGEKIAGKVEATPGLRQVAFLKRFDVGYRTWLNTTRLTMADMAFEANKEILNQPGGQQEMQKIIDNIMNATGHSKLNLGPVGTTLMVAPRWMISRFQYPAKALKHIPVGIWDTVHKKKSASRYIAKQYGKALIGAGVLSGILEGVTSAMFGAENVEADRNPLSPTFGYLTVNSTQYDMTGGMGFVIRLAAKAVNGAAEIVLGDDGVRDSDAGQSLGGMLGNRASPIVRDGFFAFQSGKPMGEREKVAMSEYLIRSSTFLSWQAVIDAMKREGMTSAGVAGIFEMHGISGFEKTKSKRKK